MLVFVYLFLDLRVGDFRGASVEQAWAGHGDVALGVDFDEFPNEGWAFHEDSGHFGVVVGHSSSRLENELELALGRVGVLAQDLSESFFAGLPHGLLDGINTAERVLDQLVVVFFLDALEGFGVDGVFGEPVRDWPLVTRDLSFDSYFGGHWSVVAAKLGFGFGDFDGGVRPDLEVDGLPRED